MTNCNYEVYNIPINLKDFTNQTELQNDEN